MTEMKIGGRVIPLLFTTFEMIAIQREIGCTASQLRDEVLGYREDEEGQVSWDILIDDVKQAKLATLIRILGNAGLEEDGKEPDLTDKWILRHMKPGMILGYGIVAMAEIMDGMSMESPAFQEADGGPVDEILEAENAKKGPGN